MKIHLNDYVLVPETGHVRSQKLWTDFYNNYCLHRETWLPLKMGSPRFCVDSILGQKIHVAFPPMPLVFCLLELVIELSSAQFFGPMNVLLVFHAEFAAQATTIPWLYWSISHCSQDNDWWQLSYWFCHFLNIATVVTCLLFGTEPSLLAALALASPFRAILT